MKSKQIICCLLASAITVGTMANTVVYALDDDDTSIPEISESLVTADEVSFTWDRSNEFGISVQTNSQSREIALRKDGGLMATSVINKSLSVEDGQIYIDTPLLKKLDDGENNLILVLKEGTLEITVNVTDDEPPAEEFELTADTVNFTWDRSNEFGISVQTNSQSRQIALRKDGGLFAYSMTNKNLSVKDGQIYIDTALLNRLDDGENHLILVLKEGMLDITVNVTDEYREQSQTEFELTVDNTGFTWDRSDELGIVVQTNSMSKQIALRKDDKLFASSIINRNLSVDNGQITIGTALLRKLNDGENTLLLVLKEGTVEISVNVTDEQTVVPVDEKEITAKTVDFTWDRSDLIGIAVYTNSSSRTVSLWKNGELLASDDDRGLYITLGRVGITSKMLKQLDDGDNQLTLVFDDGTLEIAVHVTDEKNKNAQQSEITADKVHFTWTRNSSEEIVVHTNSSSETLTVRKDNRLFASSDGKSLLIADGAVTMTSSFLNRLDDGDNHLKMIFEDGTLEITVTVVNNSANSGGNSSANGSWANTDYSGSQMPNTGSTSAVIAAVSAMLMAGAAGILTAFRKKKHSGKN